MGYIAESKELKQKRHGTYKFHCKELGIKAVSFSEFTESIYFQTGQLYRKKINKE